MWAKGCNTGALLLVCTAPPLQFFDSKETGKLVNRTLWSGLLRSWSGLELITTVWG